MTRSDRKTLGAALGVCLGIAAVVSLGGCASSGRSNAELVSPEVRMREARELAQKAERARLDGDPAKAIELYQQSIAKSDTLPLVWNNLGKLLIETENYLDGASALTAAAELEPSNPTPLTNIGTAYLKAGWAELSMDYFDRALLISPTHLPALRGALVAADSLARAEEEDLDRIRTALLREQDPAWRAWFERRRFIFENRLRGDDLSG